MPGQAAVIEGQGGIGASVTSTGLGTATKAFILSLLIFISVTVPGGPASFPISLSGFAAVS
jgi:hypothetical protein